MDQVLHGLQDLAVAYIDDILVHSLTWDDHLAHLKTVFGKLRKAGLTVKERKCSFGRASCEYLGYIVGSGTVEPMEGKIAAITEFGRQKKQKKK